MTPAPVIIDCDPGIDDTVAILTALASPELDILGISVVSGNAPLERTVRNALQICELAGRPETPVYSGCFRPLMRAPIRGQFSGVKGLGSANLPDPSKKQEATHAVRFLVDTLTEAGRTGRKITLCTLGPLTNIAVALRHGPEVAAGIERIVMMGGAFREAGNRTMTSEFNILVDPHAAHIVFSSDIPVIVQSLDATHQAIATPERIAKIRSVGGRVAELVADLLTFWDRKDVARYGSLGGPLHDPLVIVYLLRPDLFKTEQARVFVQHESEVSMGQTIADWWNKSGETPNAQIVSKVDADGVFALISERLARYAVAA
ncbi:nucleoside hydrolase [Terrarubrum flagellatum]|uniref:nucleoside hydrolase n=1 Tax=Terrirubrum flagellatum TaxID=2895980 RepID=UPI0031456005